jgi:glycosyltransferase involved in cell wall biosynthesis
VSLRVALLAYACDPTRGTESGVGWQWAAHLAARGHTIHLITRDDPVAVDSLRTAIGRTRGSVRLHAVPSPAVPSRLGTALLPAGIADYWSGGQRYLGWLAAAQSYLDDRLAGVDLVHHVTYGSIGGGSVRTRDGVPLLFGPVSGGQRAPRALRPALGPDRLGERVRDLGVAAAVRRPGRARRTLTSADLVLATNSDTARLASARGARRVQLMLADGLVAEHLVRSAPVRPLDRPTVLWIGRLRAIKLPTLAVAAFRQVLDRIPDARLRMVGDGPLRAEVERECRRLRVGHAVELVGRIPWSAVRSEYDRACVLLFTSARDAFGCQSLEAWGRALPSVGFAQHGLADFAPSRGSVLVPPLRPAPAAAALADAVVGTLTDPGRHQEMSAAALEHARSHTWDAKVDLIDDIYADLHAESRRRVRTT